MPKWGPFLEIEITGYRDIQGRFARATAEVQKATRDGLRGLGRRIVAALQVEAPVRRGRLRRGIRMRTDQLSGPVMRLRATSEAPYTFYVIRGRGPVVAGPGKVLRFEPGPPGSGFIFRKRVGPAKANPFQRRAFAALQAEGEPEKTTRSIARQIERAYSGR